MLTKAPIVLMAKSTVETVRAQDFPARQLRASQIHSPAAIRPTTTNATTSTCARSTTCACVSGWPFLRLRGDRVLQRAVVDRSTMMPITLAAAPAYMTRTARVMDGGRWSGRIRRLGPGRRARAAGRRREKARYMTLLRPPVNRRNRAYSASAAGAPHDLKLSSALAISSTNCGSRGPQREAMSSLSAKMSSS